MTETSPRKTTGQSERLSMLCDLRHALFAIHLTPLVLEKNRENPQRFHEVCVALSQECETIADLIESEIGKMEESEGSTPTSLDLSDKS